MLEERRHELKRRTAKQPPKHILTESASPQYISSSTWNMADRRCLRSEDFLTARQKCSDVLFFLDALHSVDTMEPKAGGDSEEQISRLQQEKQILEQRGQSLENKNKSLKRRIEEVLSEAAICKAHIEKEVSEKQSETMRNNIEHLTERYIAKQDEISRMKEKIDSKSDDYDTLLSEHKALQSRYRGLFEARTSGKTSAIFLVIVVRR
ncbi:hypothetical protein R1sor_009318 [Riccia sorocarpa]|uniref:Uncharacterized protein n=1 Tax=Riccia sorocarpa TaxID=122646 RepID=A0ABD3HXI0_9MARC